MLFACFLCPHTKAAVTLEEKFHWELLPLFHLAPFQEECQRHGSLLFREETRRTSHPEILIACCKSSVWAGASLLCNMLRRQVPPSFLPWVMTSHSSSTKLSPRSLLRASDESPEHGDSSCFIIAWSSGMLSSRPGHTVSSFNRVTPSECSPSLHDCYVCLWVKRCPLPHTVLFHDDNYSHNLDFKGVPHICLLASFRKNPRDYHNVWLV